MDATQRFSDRVADYRRYRPGYPPQLADDFIADGILKPGATIADIGSGTGILARVFLERGCVVIGVEPNAAMRAAGDEELGSFSGFRSVAGTAESTMLPAQSVDLITAAQAFHWFNRDEAKREFRRILRSGGICAILWNNRRTDTTPFLVAYDKLLRDFATDYKDVNHANITDEMLAGFFAPHPMRKRTYPNQQVFDFEGLKGRLLSSSYAPQSGHPSHAPMLVRLAAIFEMHQKNGQISFDYETEVYTGHL